MFTLNKLLIAFIAFSSVPLLHAAESTTRWRWQHIAFDPKPLLKTPDKSQSSPTVGSSSRLSADDDDETKWIGTFQCPIQVPIFYHQRS